MCVRLAHVNLPRVFAIVPPAAGMLMELIPGVPLADRVCICVCLCVLFLRARVVYVCFVRVFVCLCVLCACISHLNLPRVVANCLHAGFVHVGVYGVALVCMYV